MLNLTGAMKWGERTVVSKIKPRRETLVQCKDLRPNPHKLYYYYNNVGSICR